MIMPKRIIGFLISCALFLSFFPSSVFAQTYTPISADILSGEIDTFFAAGAKGYLVWQYSGDRGAEFENDKYSFFRGTPEGDAICGVLKEKASTYPDNFVGVNMWSAGDPKHTGKFSTHLNYLNKSCGVTVVRIFAKAGAGDGVKAALDAASGTGVKLIVAIGDYSNGGGGMPQGASASWYASGYQEYETFLNQVKQKAAGNPNLYGYELANEPHCGGDPNAVSAYVGWVRRFTAALSGAPNIGIGQMANTPACDNPENGDFVQSNSVSGITMASAHYYNSIEKEKALKAAAVTPSNAFFYIGEAGWGNDSGPKSLYYIYPIKGLSEVGFYNDSINNGAGSAVPPTEVQRISNTIVTDLAQQGYEATCTTPAFEIKSSPPIPDKYKPFIEPEVRLNSKLVVDLSGSKYPLWRSAGDDSLFSSLENYWGFLNPFTDPLDPFTDPLDPTASLESATIYSLLTPLQKCQQKIKILQATEALCSRLANPSTCALYQSIPGSSKYNIRSIRSAFEGQLSCEDVADGTYTGDQKELVDAVMRVPLYLNKAYRLAFLVVVTELQPEENGTFFNFLRRDPLAGSQPRQEVKVVAFRIPDTGTNKNIDPATPGYYQDPFALTQAVLTETETQLKNIADFKAIQSAIPTSVGGNRIDCSPIPGTNPLQNPTACEDPLSKALIDFVNKAPIQNAEYCGNIDPNAISSETASQIADDAGITKGLTKLDPAASTQTPTPGTPADPETLTSKGVTFIAEDSKPNYNVLRSLFSNVTGQTAAPSKAEFNFLSKIKTQVNNQGNPSKVTTYLVYPVGYDLEKMEASVIGLFDEKGIDDYVARRQKEIDRPFQEYVELNAATFAFEGGKDERRVFDAELCQREAQQAAAANRAINPDNCLATVIIGTNDSQYDRQPRVAGGLLGDIMRTVQLALHTTGTAAHDFILSCKTTEDFLTGKCSPKGSPSNTLPSNIAVLAQCRSAQTGRITSGEDAIHVPSSQDAACTLYDPNQHSIPRWQDPTDDVVDCAFLESYASCTYPKSLIANFVDSSGKFTTDSTGTTACEYVVQTAKAGGISPQFALAMWGEESGFSAYDAADFGVTSAPTNDLRAQMEGFINTVKGFNNNEYNAFLLKYSEGNSPKLANAFCANIYFPGRLKVFYEYLNKR